MSCNGCRVLRKGCSESCVLRSCLHWIKSPEAQGHATLFLSKFFGRSDLLSLISAVPESQRPVLFQSLLFEACGRTINPITGVVGLLTSGNWLECQAAVEKVLSGGIPRPKPTMLDESGSSVESSSVQSQSKWPRLTPLVNAVKVGNHNQLFDLSLSLAPRVRFICQREKRSKEDSTTSFCWADQYVSEMTNFESYGDENRKNLLNLFV